MVKNKVIPVRLDEATWQLIQRAAAEAGRTASGYLRHAGITAALDDGHLHPTRAPSPIHPRSSMATRRRSAKSSTWKIVPNP